MSGKVGWTRTIRGRLTAGALALGLIPVLLVGGAIGFVSWGEQRASIESRVDDELRGLTEVKGHEMDAYIERLTRELRILAQSSDVRHAIEPLRLAVQAPIKGSAVDTRAQLRAWYAGRFAKDYAEHNGGAAPAIGDWVENLSDAAVFMQHAYTADERSAGKQSDLVDAGDGSAYSAAHRGLHTYMQGALKHTEIDTALIVDAKNGDVIYAFDKRPDFGANLLKGPLSSSPVGKAFAALIANPAEDAVQLSEFAPYLPALDSTTAFIAVPIRDGGQTTAVLIGEFPNDGIDYVLSYHGQWRAAGLNASGETFAVGADQRFRSNARGMIEQPAEFQAQLAAQHVPTDVLERIRQRGSTAGQLSNTTLAVTAALAGQSGVAHYTNYRGVEVVGAYVPADLVGHRWAIVTEIDVSEAFARLRELRSRLAIVGLSVIAFVSLLALFAARRLSSSILRPLSALHGTVQRLADGDSSARVNARTDDEIGDVGRAFDNLAGSRMSILEAAATENESLNSSVIEIIESLAHIARRDLTVRVPVKADITGTLSDAINLVTNETGAALKQVTRISEDVTSATARVRARGETVREVAERSAHEATQASNELSQAAGVLRSLAEQSRGANQAAAGAIRATRTARTSVRATVDGILASRDQIRETEKRIKRLGERSQEIASIVTVINQIAERTSVLALNASMQAVAAGESGRGFAVVADEVKRLAENARLATQQIASQVSAIQADALDTAQTMNATIGQVVDISKIAEQAGQQMAQTETATEDLVSAVQAMTQAAEQQAELSRTLVERAQRLLGASQKTLAELGEQSRETQHLTDYSKGLMSTIEVFRLPV
jgi:methyl-accepting chemotaxis protein